MRNPARSVMGLGLLSVGLLSCAHAEPGSSGGAGAAPPAGKVALQLKLKPGDVRRYAVEVNVHTKVTANDAPVMDMPMKMSYLDVLEVGQAGADGATELKERLENLNITGEGQMGEMIKSMASGLQKVVVTSRLRADGSSVSTSIDGADNPMLEGMLREMAQGTKFTFLPKSPVGPGDSWTTEDKRPLGMGGGRGGSVLARSRHTFVRTEACGAKQCAIIDTDVELSIAEGGDMSGAGKGHSTMSVVLEDGRPSKASGQQESKFQGSQQGQPFDVVNKVTYSSQLQ